MCIYDEENVMEIKTLMTILIMIEYHSSNKYFLNKFFPGWEGGGGQNNYSLSSLFIEVKNSSLKIFLQYSFVLEMFFKIVVGL